MENTPVTSQENPAVASAPVAPAPAAAPSKGGSVGSVIAIVIIVAILVVAAFYVWGQRVANTPVPAPEAAQ